MVLFINACARKESRTKKLTDHLLVKLCNSYQEINLYDASFPKTDENYLKKRDGFIADNDFDDPMFDLARQFAKADEIVIAAPYWDLSFPAVLKQYVEAINVIGLTFTYTTDGKPKGLCRARRLWYVTTAGGDPVPDDFGFGYIDALCKRFYGIPQTKLIKAAGLDVYGNDPDGIIKKALLSMDN